MSERALVARAGDDRWQVTETTWHDDRQQPDRTSRSPPDAHRTVETFEGIVATLDFARYEGVYRRGPDGEWTAALAVWLAVEPLLWEPTPDPRGDGALVEVRSAADVAALRKWIRAAKASVADAVVAGDLDRADARSRLLAGLRRRAGDREVIAGRVGEP